VSVAVLSCSYAELVTPRCAFSVNRTSVENVEDMVSLMEFWDEVVRHQDELGGYHNIRSYAYRINIDVQVSVGWLHAGYPTQGPKGSADSAMKLSSVRQSGSWGWYVANLRLSFFLCFVSLCFVCFVCVCLPCFPVASYVRLLFFLLAGCGLPWAAVSLFFSFPPGSLCAAVP